MSTRARAGTTAGIGSPSLPSALVVLLDGVVAGTVQRATRGGPLVFAYDDTWRARRDAYSLSLALPLAGRAYEGQGVGWYLRGLLSDDPGRLARIAAQYGVSPTDSFAILAHIGEDCPGAVQFARPDRVDALVGAGAGRVAWMTDAELADELRALSVDSASMGTPEEEGQFSLPGALAKVALRYDATTKRWGRPSGRAATTHILKPPRVGEFHCENEHLCLELAREIGLEAARSRVLRVEDQVALVVERYDRETTGKTVRRLHQEDMAQALGADPDLKYAKQGAPTLQQIVALLRERGRWGLEDSLRVFQAVALNWVIAGTDAHPRNYSVLIRPGDEVILAPLYDIASGLFGGRRRKVVPEELRLAMAVGGRLTIGGIDRASWEAEAKGAGLKPVRVLDAVRQVVDALPSAVDRVEARAIADGLDATFVRRFSRHMRGMAHNRAESLAP